MSLFNNRFLPGGPNPLGAGLGFGGGAGAGLAGRGLGGILGGLDMPRQALASAFMAVGGPQAGAPEQPPMTPRDLSGYLAAMGGMGGGNPLGAASMGAAPGAMPYEMPTSPLDQGFGGSPEGAAKSGSFLPALAGLLAGGGAGLTPLAPFAIPIGGAVAGLTQGLLNNFDPQQFGNFSQEDVLRRGGAPEEYNNAWTQALSGMVMDPMSWGGLQGGNYAANRMAGMEPLLGDASRGGSMERFAQQARNVGTVGEDAAGFKGVGQIGGGLEAPPMMGPSMPAGFSPSAMPELQPNEISELLADMRLRTGSRNAAWDALSRGQPSLAEMPAFNGAMAPQGRGSPLPGTPSLPATNVGNLPQGLTPGAGPNWSMTPEQINAGGLPPTQLPPGVGDGFDAMGRVQQYLQNRGPSPAELEQMFASMSHTNVAPPPQAPFQMPMGLPPLDAGLTQGYPASAYAGLNAPLGGQPYKLGTNEMQGLLRQLGAPQEFLARGNLPPWAQLRGARVGVAPGVLPQDVARGAMGGY